MAIYLTLSNTCKGSSWVHVHMKLDTRIEWTFPLGLLQSFWSIGDDDDELEDLVKDIEDRLGRSIVPGRGSARCLRLTFDRVNTLHSILVWYCVNICTGFIFQSIFHRLLLVCWICGLSDTDVSFLHNWLHFH